MSKKSSYYRKNRVSILQTDSLLPAFISQLGFATFHKAQKRHPHHRHEGFYELCFIARGKVHWTAGGEKHEINRGNIYIVKPREVHGGVNMYMHPSKVYWLELDINSINKNEQYVLKQVWQYLRDIDCRYFPVETRVEVLFNQIIEENHTPKSFSKEFVYSKIIELLSEVCRGYDAHIKQKEKLTFEQSNKIQKALDWMNRHLNESFSVNAAAAQCGLKVSRFHQLFIKETGFSPLEFVNRQRIDLAKNKLLRTNATITEIAFPLGFNSTQYFATVFKKYCGISPSEFRKKQKKSYFSSVNIGSGISRRSSILRNFC
jgi:AraC-like DNA-binding protein